MRAWYGITLAGWLFAAPVLAEEARVRMGQTVTSLLSSKNGAADPESTVHTGREDMASRLAIWASLALVVVVCAAFWRRRSRACFSGAARGEEIEVIGRAQLSHRHAVLVLRIAGRRLVLGISGDRMTPLGSLDAQLPELPAGRSEISPGPDEKPASSRGFSARPGGREAVSAASAAQRIPDMELMPYRKQMDRLRGLLRGMREESEGGESQPEVPRP